ncbi:unnamed protein product, partial [Prorocentrum cordatum]
PFWLKPLLRSPGQPALARQSARVHRRTMDVDKKRAQDAKAKHEELERKGKLAPEEPVQPKSQEEVQAEREWKKKMQEKEALDPKAIEALEKEVEEAKKRAGAA